MFVQEGLYGVAITPISHVLQLLPLQLLHHAFDLVDFPFIILDDLIDAPIQDGAIFNEGFDLGDPFIHLLFHLAQ